MAANGRMSDTLSHSRIQSPVLVGVVRKQAQRKTGSFTISGTAKDNDKIKKVTIALVDKNGKSQNIVAYEPSSPSSTSRGISKTIDPKSYGLAAGDLNIGIWIVDKYDNVGYKNNGQAVTDRTIEWKKLDLEPTFSWSSPTAEKNLYRKFHGQWNGI